MRAKITGWARTIGKTPYEGIQAEHIVGDNPALVATGFDFMATDSNGRYTWHRSQDDLLTMIMVGHVTELIPE